MHPFPKIEAHLSKKADLRFKASKKNFAKRLNIRGYPKTLAYLGHIIFISFYTALYRFYVTLYNYIYNFIYHLFPNRSLLLRVLMVLKKGGVHRGHNPAGHHCGRAQNPIVATEPK